MCVRTSQREVPEAELLKSFLSELIVDVAASNVSQALLLTIRNRGDAIITRHVEEQQQQPRRAIGDT